MLPDVESHHLALIGLSKFNIPSRLEPSGLYRADGNRPDGVTISPWSWEISGVGCHMCGHILPSHKCALAKEAGGAAALAEKEKAQNCAHLDRAYLSNQLQWRLVG